MDRFNDPNTANIALTGDISLTRSKSPERGERPQSSTQRSSLDYSRPSNTNPTRKSSSARSSPRVANSDLSQYGHQTSNKPPDNQTSSTHKIHRKPIPPVDDREHQDESIVHNNQTYTDSSSIGQKTYFDKNGDPIRLGDLVSHP
jgi:hypothetical protein